MDGAEGAPLLAVAALEDASRLGRIKRRSRILSVLVCILGIVVSVTQNVFGIKSGSSVVVCVVVLLGSVTVCVAVCGVTFAAAQGEHVQRIKSIFCVGVVGICWCLWSLLYCWRTAFFLCSDGSTKAPSPSPPPSPPPPLPRTDLGRLESDGHQNSNGIYAFQCGVTYITILTVCYSLLIIFGALLLHQLRKLEQRLLMRLANEQLRLVQALLGGQVQGQAIVPAPPLIEVSTDDDDDDNSGSSSQHNASDERCDAPERGTCVVCLEAPPRVAIVACGHMCVCLECAPRLQRCPLCRSDITSLVHRRPRPRAPATPASADLGGAHGTAATKSSSSRSCRRPCRVCGDLPATHFVLPCAHLVVCPQCAHTPPAECPQCGTAIQSSVPLYRV